MMFAVCCLSSVVCCVFPVGCCLFYVCVVGCSLLLIDG